MTKKEVPLSAAMHSRLMDSADGKQHSLYAEGISSLYAEGVRSVYSEGIGASSPYAEGVRVPLDNQSARVAARIAQAQVRSMSQMARLHKRLERIADYLDSQAGKEKK